MQRGGLEERGRILRMNEFSSAIIAALSMIVTLDEDLVEIVLLSLQVSLGAVTIAAVIRPAAK